MKIIKKPKIAPCTCEVCKCVFKPSRRDLTGGLTGGKDSAWCPFCGKLNRVQFGEAEIANVSLIFKEGEKNYAGAAKNLRGIE